MRVMVMVKATKESEAGVIPPAEAFAAMQQYNEELVKAGILLAAEGLAPSAQGARVKFSGGRRSVTDGPFAETKEFLAGFWIVDVPNDARAIEIAAKASMSPGPGGGPIRIPIEVRRIGEAPA